MTRNFKPPEFGLMGEFNSPGDLLKAAQELQKSGYRIYDAYSPFPIHGMEEAMNLKASKLPWVVFVGGTIGLIVGFGMQTWVAIKGYPLIISGKELFSYPAWIPITFEVMVLFAAFAAVISIFTFNKLPRFYHPFFKHKTFHKATTDGYFIGIESDDPKYNREITKKLLAKLGGTNIEVLDQ